MITRLQEEALKPENLRVISQPFLHGTLTLTNPEPGTFVLLFDAWDYEHTSSIHFQDSVPSGEIPNLLVQFTDKVKEEIARCYVETLQEQKKSSPLH